jgi:hypothetical protein
MLNQFIASLQLKLRGSLPSKNFDVAARDRVEYVHSSRQERSLD